MIEFDTLFARGIIEGGGKIARHFHTPKRNPLVGFWMRKETNDLNVLLASSVEDEYGFGQRTVEGVAWDIGAHIGAVAVPLLIDNPELRVVAVEPVEDNCRLLAMNGRDNGVSDRLTVIHGAVGEPGETTTRLHVHFRGSELATHHSFVGTTENGNSDVAENWRLGTDHDIVDVPVYDYAALRAIHGPPSVIKIDCEGGEYAFFRADVSEVPLIVGEWHNIPHSGRDKSTEADFLAMLPAHDVDWVPDHGVVNHNGPGGFVAVAR